MSDDPPHPTEPNDDPGPRSHWLRTLLSALDSLDRRSGSPSNRRGTDVHVNYDLSVDSIRDAVDERRSGTDSAQDGSRRGRPTRSRRQRSSTSTSSSTPTSLTTRAYDDELVVTADVAGIDPDEITVGFDDSALVVGAAGSEIDRVDVPWAERTAAASINNGVLTVRVEPAADGDDPDTGTGDAGTDTDDDGTDGGGTDVGGER